MDESKALEVFIEKVRRGCPVEFEETLKQIEAHYHYVPQTFWNGLGEETLHNPAGTNEGSLKIFSFAALHDLSVAETLALFGAFYREHVRNHPEGRDHPNIRTFQKHGWAGIRFAAPVLEPR